MSKEKKMKIAIIAMIVTILVLLLGGVIGFRLADKPDAVTNTMLQEKIDKESADLSRKIDGVDAKIDILLNIATNAAARDFKR
jgi:flagellar basal body-associated protein FliL